MRGPGKQSSLFRNLGSSPEITRLAALTRAVDQEDEVVKSCGTKRRDKAAALAFLKMALKRRHRAEAIVTDGMRSYPAAMRELGNLKRREMGRLLNNRAESLHLPL